MEHVVDIHGKYALGDTGMYEILCDIQAEDGTVTQNAIRIVSENDIAKWIKKRREV